MEKLRTYIGIKAVQAKPMTRLQYNTLRGWEVPQDENPQDAGYLVVYPDSPNRNVDGFDGYVSWSPKEVFEKSHKETRQKVTKEYIESLIIDVAYQKIGEKTTHCMITLANGFTVTGEASCVDPKIFDMEIGKPIAYENAFEKLWSLEGYVLQNEFALIEKICPVKQPETSISNLNFGQAIEALKRGRSITRNGWNGKGMFLFLVTGQEIAKGTKFGFGQYEGEPDWNGFIAMKTADNKLVPWLASQTDVLAEDWQIV